MKSPPRTTDEYLASVPEPFRTALVTLRRQVLEAIPNATESISYGLPAFKVRGQVLVYIGAAARHCAIYGISGDGFERELAGFDLSGKGTIRFQPDHPLPASLVRRLMAQQLERIMAKAAVGRRKPSGSQ